MSRCAADPARSRLVLDDHHIGGNLPAISRPASSTSCCSFLLVDIENEGRLSRRKILDRDEQEGLPCAWASICRLRRAASRTGAGASPFFSPVHSMEFRTLAKTR
jgi:hypothetical protein